MSESPRAAEVRKKDLELDIRMKRGEAHTHDQLAEGFEKRAEEHRRYAEAFRDQIASLERRLADIQRDEIERPPITHVGTGILDLISEKPDAPEPSNGVIYGPDESFS